MARTNTKREVKDVPAPVLEAVVEPEPVEETHPATDGDLMKHQLVLKEAMDLIEQKANEIEHLSVDIADEKEREKALRHLESVSKGLHDAVAKIGVQDKKLGWVRTAIEKALAKAKAAKAKAERDAAKAKAEAEKKAAAAAKANAK